MGCTGALLYAGWVVPAPQLGRACGKGRREGWALGTSVAPSLSSPPGSRKGKWDEDDFEEDLGEEEEEEDEEEEEEDYEEEEDMGEEGLSSAEAVRAGAGSLLLRKPPAPQHYRGEPPRLPGGQERLPPGLGHAQPPPPAPDHGDWTYEEQFKQVCAHRDTRVPAVPSLSLLLCIRVSSRAWGDASGSAASSSVLLGSSCCCH